MEPCQRGASRHRAQPRVRRSCFPCGKEAPGGGPAQPGAFASFVLTLAWICSEAFLSPAAAGENLTGGRPTAAGGTHVWAWGRSLSALDPVASLALRPALRIPGPYSALPGTGVWATCLLQQSLRPVAAPLCRPQRVCAADDAGGPEGSGQPHLPERHGRRADRS